MTFNAFIDKHHLKVNVLQRREKHFTLDDMEACWKAAAKSVAQLVVDISNGKFEHLPHRLEDEKQ